MDVYTQAAEIVNMVRNCQGTAKSLCLRKEIQKKRQTYAVVCETLRHYKLLEDVLDNAEFFQYYPKYDRNLTMVLAYDTVLGKGVKTKQNKVAVAVQECERYLKSAYEKVKKHHTIVKRERSALDDDIGGMESTNISSSSRGRRHRGDAYIPTGDTPNGGIGEYALPKYARVNTLLTSIDEVLTILDKRLKKRAREELEGSELDEETEREWVEQHREFTIDTDIPNLLKFPPNSNIQAHPLVKYGKLVLQDKASCIPPCVLLDAVTVVRDVSVLNVMGGDGDNNGDNVSGESHVNEDPDTEEVHETIIDSDGEEVVKKKKRTIDNELKTVTCGNKNKPKTILVDPLKPFEYVIDACSAPGNKTSQLAALGKSTAIKLMAVEKDERRFETLSSRVKQLGASEYINCVNGDFFNLPYADRECAEAIMLDPSCSASGVISRVDIVLSTETAVKRTATAGAEAVNNNIVNNYQLVDETDEDGIGWGRSICDDKDAKRVENLARVQKKMLTHSLLSFPNCRRVVYSTCSIHEKENEDVVRQVLDDERVRMLGWRLSNIMPQWMTRGRRLPDDIHQLEYTIRCDPTVDATNGFYVSCFDRILVSE